MRKLILACECGQRIQLPRNAVGKTGVCPTCGRAIPITKNNTKPLTAKERKKARMVGAGNGNWTNTQGGAQPTEESRRLFGRGADLFCEGRYGEALAIFDSLARQFPGIPEIENARKQCMAARQRPLNALPRPGETPSAGPEMTADPETVKRVVLEKMLHARSEAIQLQAAEIMARILGMFDHKPKEAAPEPETSPPEPEPEPEPEVDEAISEIVDEDDPASPKETISFTDFTIDTEEMRAQPRP